MSFSLPTFLTQPFAAGVDQIAVNRWGDVIVNC